MQGGTRYYNFYYNKAEILRWPNGQRDPSRYDEVKPSQAQPRPYNGRMGRKSPANLMRYSATAIPARHRLRRLLLASNFFREKSEPPLAEAATTDHDSIFDGPGEKEEYVRENIDGNFCENSVVLNTDNGCKNWSSKRDSNVHTI